jgi:hypothetical protein
MKMSVMMRADLWPLRAACALRSGAVALTIVGVHRIQEVRCMTPGIDGVRKIVLFISLRFGRIKIVFRLVFFSPFS